MLTRIVRTSAVGRRTLSVYRETRAASLSAGFYERVRYRTEYQSPVGVPRGGVSRTQFSHDCRRIPLDDDLFGDIFGNDGSRCDDGVVTDRHTGVEDGLAANPDVVTNAHSFPVLGPFGAFCRLYRMRRRVEMGSRSNRTVVPDIHSADVQDDTVEIRTEILTSVDIVPVIATKGRGSIIHSSPRESRSSSSGSSRSSGSPVVVW